MVDLAREYGVAQNTLYRWQAKYGGMEVSEAARLKALEDENAKLKRRRVYRWFGQKLNIMLDGAISALLFFGLLKLLGAEFTFTFGG